MPVDAYVDQSTLNTSTSIKKRARTGYNRPIVDAGLGLFTERAFRRNEPILNYRYIDGGGGESVEMLTKAQHDARYAGPGKPGSGTHVLNPWGSPIYYDTKRSGGIGGRANTNPGKQNARFKGTQLVATRAMRPNEEVFASYGSQYKFPKTTGERSGWERVKPRKK